MSRFIPQGSDDAVIDQRLEKYGRFGVHLGLERIQRLLTALENPEKRVPIVHVAGTNGKGSVCAYVSSVLAQAGYRVGRYTSPHLVSWCERIRVNGEAISPSDLLQALAQVEAAITPEYEIPTQFEVFTAAAWLYFAQQAVDIAVIEVGLGGRLDATNVVDEPLVAVIVSLSREHWQRLGPTLADIAGEKAGVLKAHRPAVVGPLPVEAEQVVLKRAKDLGCAITRPQPAQMEEGWAFYHSRIAGQAVLKYRVPFAGAHQLTNSAIAIATLYALRDQGWTISTQAIQDGIAQARWPGRLQWLNWDAPDGQPYRWLLDGAHNPAAAKVLREYVDTHRPRSVTWLMGMLTTKDHADVFRELLRSGDRLHLVPVPGHSSMEPEALQEIALSVCPQLATYATYPTLEEGLRAASRDDSELHLLCGSLYLIGYFFQTQTTHQD